MGAPADIRQPPDRARRPRPPEHTSRRLGLDPNIPAGGIPAAQTARRRSHAPRCPGVTGTRPVLAGRGVAGFRSQAARAMPPQAAIEPRARDVGVEELAHHREQVVQRQQQRLGQCHCLLRRREGGLKPVRRVAPGLGRCRACAISRPSARRCRSARQSSRPAPYSPGSPPGSSVSSSPACVERSACSASSPDLAQDRSCRVTCPPEVPSL